MNRLGPLFVAAAALIVLAPAIQAQILPSVGLYTEVLGFNVDPPGDAPYGTLRTFTATIVNVETTSAAQAYSGNISFVDGNNNTLCTTTALNDTSLVGVVLNTSMTDPNLQIAALQQIASLGGIVNPLLGQLTAATVNTPAVQTLLQTLLGATNLYPLKVSAAAVATCTTPFNPAGNYTNLNVALTNLMLNGNTVGLGGVLGNILNPLVTLSAFNFNVAKANTVVFGVAPPPVLPGATTSILVEVNNTNSPPSILPLEGGSITVLLGNVTIGTNNISTTPAGRRRLLALTSPFLVTITIPTGTVPGALPLTLLYSGDNNFNPSISGQNGSPAGPTIVVPILVAVTASANPATPPAGSQTTITGTLTNPLGTAAPTGAVTLTLNGQTYPAVLTPGTGGVSTFTAVVPAPLIASLSTGSPYPVVVNYAPDTPGFAAPVPPFSFNLPVGLAASSITQTVTPATPAANAPVTVAGTITAPAGITPTGTVTVTVTATNGTSTQFPFPVNGGAFTGVFPAPGVPGTYTVTSTFNPAPGSSLAGSTSAPSTLTVSPAGATITETVNPNPAGSGATVTVSGNVTNADGSPGSGTVQLYLNGVPIGGPVTLGPGGVFTTTFPAPTTPGTYTLLTTYTPTGASAPTASYSTTFTVSGSGGGGGGGGGSGGGSTTLTITFGNGGNGFAFPNCLGNLNVTVSGSGTPPPTGGVTLSLTGGIFGTKGVTLGTVNFLNGQAVFDLESIKLSAAIHDKMFQGLKSGLGLKAGLGLLPNGVFALLPDTYGLTACYAGDNVYGAICTNGPFIVDPLCLLEFLRLVT